ncbi:8756_t:CDS:1, partial [Acaulospora morrowiae]
LTQTIDKIIMQMIEKVECNNKPNQTINKLLIQEFGKGFKTYIEKPEQDYNLEIESELENRIKGILTISKFTVKNHVVTNNTQIGPTNDDI